MNILIYDHDIQELDKLYDMIKSISNDFIIHGSSELTDFYSQYCKQVFDYVLINCDNIEGQELLDEIHELKPQQKLIALTDNVNCQDKQKCQFCKQEQNKFLLIRPIYTNDLFYIIFANAKRPDYCDNDNMLLKLKKIDKNFHNFNLCMETKVFINKNSFLKRNENVGEILDALEEHAIDYEVDATQNIKIIHQQD